MTAELQKRLTKKLKGDALEEVPGPFFVYSTNIDTVTEKAGFSPCEIFEIHGSLNNWQCSEPCTNEIWEAPADFNFKVDLKTMLAKSEESTQHLEHTVNKGFINNHPRCKNCGKLSRPSVFMFGDSMWIHSNEVPWWNWRTEVLNMLKKYTNANMVIIEIGCGKSVSTLRNHSETILQLTDQCKLIRINLDFPYSDSKLTDSSRVISIKEKSLPALVAIDKELHALMEASTLSPLRQKIDGYPEVMIVQS